LVFQNVDTKRGIPLYIVIDKSKVKYIKTGKRTTI